MGYSCNGPLVSQKEQEEFSSSSSFNVACGCGYGNLGWILAHSIHGPWKSLLLYVIGCKTKLILYLY
jgi:hypothetical protein